MPKTLTAADRSQLIRLASSMEKGSDERKAILAGLKKTAFGGSKTQWSALLKQLRFTGWVLADENFWNQPPINRSGLDALWEKKFEVGESPSTGRPIFATYGVTLTARLSDPEGVDVDALMSWEGPDRFGHRSNERYMYSEKFPGAFIGSGRRWQVSPDLVRWAGSTFKKVEKHIKGFVQEDIEGKK